MSDMYAIKTTTLTALGDAVRNKTGKFTREEEVPVAVKYDVNLVNIEGNYNDFSKRFEKAGMVAAKLKLKNFSGSACDKENVQFYYNRTNEQGAPEYGNIQFTFDENNEAFIENLPNQSINFWFRIFPSTGSSMSCGFTLEIVPYDADGNSLSVTETVTVTNTMTPLEMVEEINNIPPSPTAEDLVITGNCSYKFSYGGWDWVSNMYGNLITTKDITNMNYMFSGSKLENIPFEINCKSNTNINLNRAFEGTSFLTTLPKINNVRPSEMCRCFAQSSITHIPDDYCDNWDWSYLNGLTSAYSGECSGLFTGCNFLRSFPMTFFENGNPNINLSYSTLKEAFQNCNMLDEVVDLPNTHYKGTYTSYATYSHLFYNTFNGCWRLKRFTFREMDAPKWSQQVLDLSNLVGWGQSYFQPSGVMRTKEIKDAETYALYKDDPDSWTTNVKYSRYNRLSAIETLNSLPDTTATGTNTIKFKGEAGELTDGGAINTLTEEEIAVAAVKGWTVTFA